MNRLLKKAGSRYYPITRKWVGEWKDWKQHPDDVYGKLYSLKNKSWFKLLHNKRWASNFPWRKPYLRYLIRQKGYGKRFCEL